MAPQVGCGKSSLLAALLAEITPTGGPNTLPLVRGSMAYCAQQPWIIAGTLRDNILFGLAYDPVRYHKTLEGCALVDDIGALPAGDLTELGERGINLSGGQKVRVGVVFTLTRKLDCCSGKRSGHVINLSLGPPPHASRSLQRRRGWRWRARRTRRRRWC